MFSFPCLEGADSHILQLHVAYLLSLCSDCWQGLLWWVGTMQPHCQWPQLIFRLKQMTFSCRNPWVVPSPFLSQQANGTSNPSPDSLLEREGGWTPDRLTPDEPELQHCSGSRRQAHQALSQGQLGMGWYYWTCLQHPHPQKNKGIIEDGD